MFTHVKQSMVSNKLHISHLHDYVSAYHKSPEEIEFLVKMIEYALVEAKMKGKTQIVDRDGECCFHVTPAGYLILMLPWKTYEIIEEKKW